MKIANQRVVFVLIFAFYGPATRGMPLPLNAALPHLTAERGERLAYLPGLPGTTDNQRAEGNANPESFEKLAERAREAMDAERVPEALQLHKRGSKLHIVC